MTRRRTRERSHGGSRPESRRDSAAAPDRPATAGTRNDLTPARTRRPAYTTVFVGYRGIFGITA